MEQNMIIMCGLPCSGKSTLIKNRLVNLGYAVVSPDNIRLSLHGQQFCQNAEPFVWATAEVMARSLLIGGNDVVIDATNINKQRRKLWINLAKEFNILPTVYFVNNNVNECLKRNEDILRMGSHIITRMYKNFQIPNESEGCIVVDVGKLC